MSHITTLEINKVRALEKDYYTYLSLEKALVESYFPWLELVITGNVLKGEGNLEIGVRRYPVSVLYSPFFYDRIGRFDIIKIEDKSIRYNKNILLYRDMSLCLYHPIIDKPPFEIIPLVKMIPWITEWCVHFDDWKKYGVWLGKEILH